MSINLGFSVCAFVQFGPLFNVYEYARMWCASVPLHDFDELRFGRAQIYGKQQLFDAERVVDLLQALEAFSVASASAQGDRLVNAATAALPAQNTATAPRLVCAPFLLHTRQFGCSPPAHLQAHLKTISKPIVTSFQKFSKMH